MKEQHRQEGRSAMFRGVVCRVTQGVAPDFVLSFWGGRRGRVRTCQPSFWISISRLGINGSEDIAGFVFYDSRS